MRLLVGGVDVTDALEWSQIEQHEVSLKIPGLREVHLGDEVRVQSREPYPIPLIGRLLLRWGYGRLVMLGIFRVSRVTTRGDGSMDIDGQSLAKIAERMQF